MATPPLLSPTNGTGRLLAKSTSPNTDTDKALLLLEVIHPKFADRYDSWIFIGMSLKYISPELLPAWDKWSQLSSKYKPGECAYKWETFNGNGITDRTLHFYARNS